MVDPREIAHLITEDPDIILSGVEEQIEAFKSILVEEGYELAPEEIIILLEAGIMDKIKKFGKAAALTGVLGASALGGGENSQARKYSFDYQNLRGNNQAQLDLKNDKEAERAGFTHGYSVNSITTLEKQTITSIEKELERSTQKDVLIEIVSIKNLGTGGREVLIQASGEITADSKQHAKLIIENKIKEVAQKNNIDLTGLNSLITAEIVNIQPTEAVGTQKFKFKTKISFKS